MRLLRASLALKTSSPTTPKHKSDAQLCVTSYIFFFGFSTLLKYAKLKIRKLLEFAYEVVESSNERQIENGTA